MTVTSRYKALKNEEITNSKTKQDFSPHSLFTAMILVLIALALIFQEHRTKTLALIPKVKTQRILREQGGRKMAFPHSPASLHRCESEYYLYLKSLGTCQLLCQMVCMSLQCRDMASRNLSRDKEIQQASNLLLTLTKVKRKGL